MDLAGPRCFLLMMLLQTFPLVSISTREKRGYGPTVVPLTDREKMEIVMHHNDLRRLSYSSNMRFMSWDSELEWIAMEYSKKCDFTHNKERKHSRGWSVGENIYVTGASMIGSQAVRAVQSWYDENKYFSYNTRRCTPGKMCGHYTQVVWAETFKVGCAMTSCKYLTNVRWKGAGSIFVCNYATAGNVVTPAGNLLSVFEKGSSCSNCDNDDYCRNHLCANSERDFLLQSYEDSGYNSQDQGNSAGLLSAVIVLAVIIVLLLAFTLYRERVRITVKLGLWRVGAGRSNKFSNQNTPSASTFNTPRHSITGTSLHGVPRLTTADIGSPLEKLKASERRQCTSAPTTPRHGYAKGSPTPHRVPPPIPPPALHKK